MEEILASIRRIIADDGEEDKSIASSEPVKFPTVAGSVARAETAFALPERPRPLTETRMSDRPSLDVEMPEISFGDLSLDLPEPERAEEPAPPVQSAPPATASAREPAPAPLGSLISSGATETVGRAFNMLSQTVLSENARTLEDLVQEMLKPMLKMWLDDNLPPLVERLVRNEIERVARGRA